MSCLFYIKVKSIWVKGMCKKSFWVPLLELSVSGYNSINPKEFLGEESLGEKSVQGEFLKVKNLWVKSIWVKPYVQEEFLGEE